jgi:hypothetical protein
MNRRRRLLRATGRFSLGTFGAHIDHVIEENMTEFRNVQEYRAGRESLDSLAQETYRRGL